MATYDIATRDPDRESVLKGSVWMVGISLLLFFLPAVNGFIGGLVGGYKVGGAGRALGAAVLPAIVAGVLLWILLGLFEAPVIGFFSGVALVLLIVFSSLGLLLGAFIGGAMSSRGGRRQAAH